MKKTVRIVALALLVLVLVSAGVIQAEIIPPYGPDQQIGPIAVVLCESLSVRKTPSFSAKTVQTLEFGTQFSVLAEKNGWAQVCLSDDVDASPEGWVNMEYIAVDPAWYKTEQKTAVYAWNDTKAPKVALLDKRQILPILKQEGDWLLVSLRGAVGWIKK